MTKIILSNGVIHVKENYDAIIELISISIGFVELTEINSSKQILGEINKNEIDKSE